MAKHVVVLDYGSGNLRSAQRALQRVGAEVAVSADPAAARDADGLVVPGVGAFAACMAGLAAVRGGEAVRARLAAGRPVLGICVGMQVLFESGAEHGVRTAGLGVLPGRVERLRAPILPHMGWNTVTAPAGSALFAGLDADTRFYFVHSYGVTDTTGLATGAVPTAPAPGVAGRSAPGPTVGDVTTCCYGERFVAAVESGPVCATQFHPEKSGDAGAALLANWLETL